MSDCGCVTSDRKQLNLATYTYTCMYILFGFQTGIQIFQFLWKIAEFGIPAFIFRNNSVKKYFFRTVFRSTYSLERRNLLSFLACRILVKKFDSLLLRVIVQAVVPRLAFPAWFA